MAEFEKMLRTLSGGELIMAAESLYDMLRPAERKEARFRQRGEEWAAIDATRGGDEENSPAGKKKAGEREFLSGGEMETFSPNWESFSPKEPADFREGEENFRRGERAGFAAGYIQREEESLYPEKLSPAEQRLGAEALSEYFRRDSRRYDSGFQRY